MCVSFVEQLPEAELPGRVRGRFGVMSVERAIVNVDNIQLMQYVLERCLAKIQGYR